MKKGMTRIAASIAVSAFAIAASALHLDWVGYKYFDHDDGSNILCTIDPKCRNLTEGEIAIAKKYFDDRIDYKNVKVFDRPFLYMLNHRSAGMAPNGNVYFLNKHSYRPDFAQAPEAISGFIHEMTHVAQYQSGINIPGQAFVTLLKHGFNYSAAYDYKINTAHSYSEMNLEQQAQIMEHYFIKRREFEEQTTAWLAQDGYDRPTRAAPFGSKWLEQHCDELKLYESKLFPTYPTQPDEMCQSPDKRLVLRPKNTPQS